MTLVVLRLSLFSHKIINVLSAPEKLKEQILFNCDRNIKYNLRQTSKPTLYLPKINNHYGELTFKYFFNKFVEKICVKHINMPFIDFRRHIINNLISFCTNFISFFEKFDIAYKKVCFINYKKKKINELNS